MQLTSKQQQAVDLAVAGRNLYITGFAGTGKSVATRAIIDALEQMGKKVIAVAPTGVAANNINGATIHSTFAINPYKIILSIEDCNFVKQAKKEVLHRADAIVVDEISMLRPDILDCMHLTLIRNGVKGGLKTKQIIFVGDLEQLPPVLKDNARSVMMTKYDGDTFLDAEIFPQLDVLKIELDEILRQNDTDFIRALNEIRAGNKAPYFRQFFHQEPHGIILAPHNATVQSHNERGLAAQPGELLTFKAIVDGDAKPEDFTLENEIRVKHGCKIMYLVNSQDNPLRNGTLGEFVCRENSYFIKVGQIDYALKKVVEIKKEYVWKKATDTLELEEKGSIIQYPFKLAYALSIHKAQGLTFEELTVDLRRPCFIRQQYYVALSRATGPAGLRIIIP